MRRRGVRAVVLCEDILHATFARRFLMGRGFARHEIHQYPLPRDKGCGEQFVRQQFPLALRAYRSTANYLSQGLVVIVDADTGTVEERAHHLDEACRKQDVPAPRSDERVLLAIPRRNIATWLAYLDGEQVNERDDYLAQERRYKGREADCGPLVDRLDRMCLGKHLDGMPPASLEACCLEFERFWRLIEERGR